jgi:hypothetical protein
VKCTIVADSVDEWEHEIGDDDEQYENDHRDGNEMKVN